MQQDQESHGPSSQEATKEFTLIVNTREKKWPKKEISYEEIVALAFGSYDGNPNIVYTVTYSRGPKPHQEGSLVKGESVQIQNEMIFNVTKTDKS
jgi:hypothetical protein